MTETFLKLDSLVGQDVIVICDSPSIGRVLHLPGKVHGDGFIHWLTDSFDAELLLIHLSEEEITSFSHDETVGWQIYLRRKEAHA